MLEHCSVELLSLGYNHMPIRTYFKLNVCGTDPHKAIFRNDGTLSVLLPMRALEGVYQACKREFVKSMF